MMQRYTIAEISWNIWVINTKISNWIIDRCQFNVIYEKPSHLFPAVETYANKFVKILHKDLHFKSIKSESEHTRTNTHTQE